MRIGTNRKLTGLIYFVAILIIVFALDRLASAKLINYWDKVSIISRIWHSYYHHGLESNVNIIDQWGNNFYPLVTNSIGNKSKVQEEVPGKSDRTRVLFLGDSFTEGIGIPYDNTFVGLFDNHFTGLEVLNGGVAGFSPKLMFLKAKYLIEVLDINVDEIVIYTGPDDIYDDLFYCDYTPDLTRHPDSIYSMRKRQRVSKIISRSFILFNLHKTGIIQRQKFARTIQEGAKFADIQVVMGRIPAAQSTKPRMIQQDFLDDLLCENNRVDITQETNSDSIQVSWTYDSTKYIQWGRHGMNVTKRNMKFLYDLCKLHQIGLTICIYPWPVNLELNNHCNNAYVGMWHKFADSLGIDLIDHSIDFQGSEIDDLFINGDVHWNEMGHARIAATLISNWDSIHK